MRLSSLSGSDRDRGASKTLERFLQQPDGGGGGKGGARNSRAGSGGLTEVGELGDEVDSSEFSDQVRNSVVLNMRDVSPPTPSLIPCPCTQPLYPSLISRPPSQFTLIFMYCMRYLNDYLKFSLEFNIDQCIFIIGELILGEITQAIVSMAAKKQTIQ